MKRISFLLAFLTVFVIACQDSLNNIDKPVDDSQKELIIDEALQQTIIDDLLNDIDFYSGIGDGWTKSAEMEFDCPTITIVRGGDKRWPCEVTLDFGTGCEKWGKVKSGKMIIHKTGPWKEAGSVRTITFDGYQVDGMAISGKKIITNISEEGGDPTFKIEAFDLTTSYTKEFASKDGEDKKESVSVVVTRNVDKTQKWVAGFLERDVVRQVVLNGTADVNRKVGDEVKTIKKVFTDILIKRGCRFPQAGTTEFDIVTFDGDPLKFALNYDTAGDAGEKCKGDCDCYATLSVGDEQESLDLSDRWWNKAKEDKKKE